MSHSPLLFLRLHRVKTSDRRLIRAGGLAPPSAPVDTTRVKTMEPWVESGWGAADRLSLFTPTTLLLQSKEGAARFRSLCARG